MEQKKNPNADLEKWRSIFFLSGILISLMAVLIAFNVSSTENIVDDLPAYSSIRFEEEQAPQTIQPYQPPAQASPPPQVFDNFDILKDNTKITDEFVSENQENQNDIAENIANLFQQFGENDEEQIYVQVDKMPQFPGGELGLRKFIATQVKYPKIASDKKIEGIVYIKFCVTSTGLVDKVSIMQGVDPMLDQEALRVVMSLPRWIPGERLGKKVNVWYNLPINFHLNR
jgi:periplasmic protein TonB